MLEPLVSGHLVPNLRLLPVSQDVVQLRRGIDANVEEDNAEENGIASLVVRCVVGSINVGGDDAASTGN